MSDNEQPRRPKGAPSSTGGQWREAVHSESDLDLPLGRESALTDGGDVAANFLTSPAGDSAQDWWDDQYSVAEWSGEGSAYAKLPGDWTPRRLHGSAETGKRRTHRRTYRGNGFGLRMPSATSIKSFAQHHDTTFDVPVEATNDAGQTVTAWVRATRNAPGSWSVSGLGFGGTTDAQVSEAVASILEARRPTGALRDAGNLIEKHRERLTARGVDLTQVRSTWIASVGYNDVDRIMLMRTKPRTNKTGQDVPGKTYGHQVDREVFEQLRSSDRPGTMFNKFVRGNPGQRVTDCPNCGSTHLESRQHACQGHHAALAATGQEQGPYRASGLRGLRRRQKRRRRTSDD